MELTLKLKDVLNLNNALKAIIDEIDIDALLKFRLLGIMKEIENHVTNFNLICNEKISEFGTKDEEGNITIPSEDKEAIRKFNDVMRKVTDSEVSINVIKIKSTEIFSKGIKSEYLIWLYPIIEEQKGKLMFKYFKMKKNEWKIKAVIYGIIASVMDNQQEIIETVKKIFLSLKDISAEDMQQEFISKITELIYEENRKE